MAVCEKHGAVLVEDAAESFDATYKGKQTGTFGSGNIISFNGNKDVPTHSSCSSWRYYIKDSDPLFINEPWIIWNAMPDIVRNPMWQVQ